MSVTYADCCIGTDFLPTVEAATIRAFGSFRLELVLTRGGFVAG